MEVAAETEVRARKEAVAQLLAVICDAEGQPILVSDQSTLWDFTTLSADEILAALSRAYPGARVTPEHLQLPLWTLVDLIDALRPLR